MSKLTSMRVDAIMRRFLDELREAILEEAVETFNKRGSDKLTKEVPAVRAVKRTPEELDRLAATFLKRVTRIGGQTIEEAAKVLHVETKELLLPIKMLKAKGWIKTTGHYRATRYYAVVND
jgi:hypothetical protein